MKIGDFGISKQLTEKTRVAKTVVGTELYSCPEVIKNLPYSEKVDIWALGVLLY